jgi:membrane protease subunit HflC
MQLVTQRSDEAARSYGIEVVDVRIKRADLPPENEAAVYNRMRAERAREAKTYRSEGEEQALTIRAETDLEASRVRAVAEEDAQRVRGQGDAEALRIYAEAYTGATEFYEFTRTLAAYEKALNEKTHIVLPADGDFFKLLKGK